MSFTTKPSKSSFLELQAVPFLVPEYKSGFSCCNLPHGLLICVGNNTLLYLQSGFSEADSVLSFSFDTAETRRPQSHAIVLPLQPPLQSQEWVTVLEVAPAALVVALLSKTGLLVYLQLQVSLTAQFTASVLKTEQLLLEDRSVVKAVSLCFEGDRYFVIQTSDRNIHLFHWFIKHQKVSSGETVIMEEPSKIREVFQSMLKDYGTENNIVGYFHRVLYYDGVCIAQVPKKYRIVSVFGVECGKFQLIVVNKATQATEWWRWTGEDCEAVLLLGVQNLKGNLVWM